MANLLLAILPTVIVTAIMFLVGFIGGKAWRKRQYKKENDMFLEVKALKLENPKPLSELEVRHLFALAYFYKDKDLDDIHARAARDLGEQKATSVYREVYEILDSAQGAPK